jgi:NAD(P)-dependent dehydrogenase (short-subunit alcohol dehydrogenase family)
MQRLKGSVVMVAGGGGAIGTASCIRLAAEGAKVCVGDIDERSIADVIDKVTAIGGEIEGTRLDLGDEASIRAAFAAARRRFGAIDLLQCNGAMTGAPMLHDTSALDISLDTWNLTLKVDLTGYLICTKEALPDMIAKKQGAIVYISSGAVYTPENVRVAYGVAKAGVNVLMRHVAHVWGKQGIRANAITPGPVLTPPTAALGKEMLDKLLELGRSPRLGVPEDIAAMVAMLLSQDAAWVNGQTIAVDGGLSLRQ